MTLFERLRFRLSALRAALEIGPSALPLAWRMRPVAGGADDEDDEGGEDPKPADPKPAENDDDKDDDLDLPRAKAKINKANQEAASLRKRAKEAEDRLKAIEDKDKSEVQKLADQAAEDKKNAATATQEAARLRVALRKGLTETQAKRLVGETEEELEQDAEDLIKDFGQGQEPADTNRRPKERLRPGATPSAEPEEENPEKLAALVPDF